MKKRILFAIALCLLVYSRADALPTANSIITAQTPSRGTLAQFLNASTPNTTFITIYTAGANGSRINGLWVDNNDPSATHIVACQIVNAATKFGGCSLTTVSPAGATAFANASLLTSGSCATALPFDSDGQPYLMLASGDTLQCNFQTTITSGDQVDVHAQGADF